MKIPETEARRLLEAAKEVKTTEGAPAEKTALLSVLLDPGCRLELHNKRVEVYLLNRKVYTFKVDPPWDVTLPILAAVGRSVMQAMENTDDDER